MVKVIFIFKNIQIAFDRIFFKDIIDLFQIMFAIPPNKDNWNSFESVDKWEKKAMNEVIMMNGVKVVE